MPLWLALIGGGISGALTAVQTRLNGGLGQAIGDGYLTAAFSFITGLVILVIALCFSRRAQRGMRLVGDELRSKRLPIWALSGGACGAVFVIGQSAVAPLLGVALFTVSVVAGQVLGGLVLDRIGVGPGGRVDPSLARVLGSVLVVVAVVLSVVADLLGGADYVAALWLVIIPLIAGIAVAWQAGVNGLLRSAAQSVTAATLISFIVGTVFVVIIAGVSVGVNGWPSAWPADPLLYVGGPLGVIVVALLALLVRPAGVLLLGMSNVAGQLVASVVLEATVPLAGGVTVWLILGTVVALGALVIASLPPRRTAQVQ